MLGLELAQETQAYVSLAILFGMFVLFVRETFPVEVTAMIGAAAMILVGILPEKEALKVLSNNAPWTIALMFMVMGGLVRTGAVELMINAAEAHVGNRPKTTIAVLFLFVGLASAVMNNTPLVAVMIPVVMQMANKLGVAPSKMLIPLSHMTVMGGMISLIGTSTNLLVNDMARNAGQPVFSIFEITPVGLGIALVGTLWLYFVGARQLGRAVAADEAEQARLAAAEEAKREQMRREAERKRRRLPFGLPRFGESRTHEDGSGDAHLGDVELFSAADRPFELKRALISAGVFVLVVACAGLGLAPIAAAAFAGAVALILLKVITPEEAYAGLRPEILLLIAGMVVVGVAIEVTGLADAGAQSLISVLEPFGPLAALIVLYGVTLFATELLSNATVAVLITPIAVALAESLGVDPRPFLVAVMMAASAAFATPFGYQTNVLVYQMGGYSYMDFVRIGVPLNLITWAAAMVVIPIVFPF